MLTVFSERSHLKSRKAVHIAAEEEIVVYGFSDALYVIEELSNWRWVPIAMMSHLL